MQMENSEVFEKIKLFIKNERYEYDFSLKRDTMLQRDLGITGDDAIEFILSFGKTFNVDVSNFMLADYFDGEGDYCIDNFIRVLIGKKTPQRDKELTLGDLERAVIIGKLDETVIGT